jgi:hypothetical protein
MLLDLLGLNKAIKQIKCKLQKLQKNIPSAQVNSDWNATTGVAEILNKPIIPQSYINVTYAQLVALKNNNSLIKNQVYRLTDYMTTYNQPVTGIYKESGIIEPLYITAVDVNKLHNECKSELYPQDIVYYEITGKTLQVNGGGTSDEGFTKGKIYRRIDTKFHNDIGTDWRHVKYNRDGVDKLLFPYYSAAICYNTINTYYLFNNVIECSQFYNNTIGNNFNNNTFTMSSNFIINNTIKNNFKNNTINGTIQYCNIIGIAFSNNTINNSFVANIIEYRLENSVLSGFSYNKVVDVTTIVMQNSSGNTFLNVANLGTIETPFRTNNTEFRRNIYVNFVPTNEILNNIIDVVVYSTQSGVLKQKYYNSSNVLIINNIVNL